MMNTNKKYTFYLEITTSCNFSCPFCPSSKKETHYYMNEKDIYHIIDEIGNHIEIIYFHVLGEPFLHPNFIDILNYVESKKIYFGITTNGVLLNNFKEEVFKYHYLKKVNISLQSLIQLKYDEIDDYMNNLKCVINYRKSIDSKIPINLRLWNNKDDINIIKLNSYIYEINNDFINNNVNIRISEADEFEWPDERKVNNDVLSSCLGGKKQFAILHDGTICLCCLDYQGKTKLGNLLHDNFCDILNSDLYNTVINHFNDHKPYFKLCQTCTFRNRFK